jgi:hypothetical protein
MCASRVQFEDSRPALSICLAVSNCRRVCNILDRGWTLALEGLCLHLPIFCATNNLPTLFSMPSTLYFRIDRIEELEG